MGRLRENAGVYILWMLAVLPAVRWLMLQPLESRFSEPFMVLTSIGQLLALTGISLFALTLILSGRFKFIEGYFGGMNKVYANHHKYGAYAFVLLLFHPLSLAGAYAVFSLKDAFQFLVPANNWAVNFGMVSLYSLMLLLVLTLFARVKYHNWKFTHQFMGVAFFFGALHAFLIPSDVSSDLALRIYVLGLAAVALAVYVYRTVLGRFLVRKADYAVETVRKLGDKAVEVEMAPLKQALSVKAGQFVFVSFHQQGVSPEAHPFSLTSSPSEKKLKIGVKALGDYTKELADLKPGALARIEGPFGQFSKRYAPQKTQVWIAGGIGVTPFVSMAKDLKAQEKADLYYCVNTLQEAFFLPELEGIAQEKKGLRVMLWLTNEKGYLKAQDVEKESGPLSEKETFICGPVPMMQKLKRQFYKKGVYDVHSEEFELAEEK